jgi:hypothetical protein
MSTDRIDPHSREYLQQLLAAEAELGELLGYGKARLPGIESMTRHTLLYPVRRDGTGALESQSLPRWRRDWCAAGKLISRCDLSLSMTYSHFVRAKTACGRHSAVARYTDHPDKDAAILAVIISAATLLLRAQREARQMLGQ